MFSLIISIIAIALVAALALASIFYGGSALTQGTAEAEATRYINDASQVTMANALAAAQGNTQTTVSGLVTANYLASAPAELDDALDNGDVTATVASADVCTKVNDKTGYVDTAGSADAAAAILAVQSANVQFGCETDVGGVHTFVFKG